MKIQTLALGIALWAGLAVTAACVVETGGGTTEAENIGEAQSELQDYGQPCNPFGNPCKAWLQCCGTFPYWETYRCRCGPSCTTCGGDTECYPGDCYQQSSRCCADDDAQHYCDQAPFTGCMDAEDECSCVSK